MSRKLLILSLVVLAIAVVLFLIIRILSVQTTPPLPKPSPTPTEIQNPPIPGQSEEYIKGGEKALEEDKPLVIKLQNIIAMRKSLPYQGNNFTLSYSISDDSYVVTFNQDSLQEGEDEFNQFLLDKGIDKNLIAIKTVAQ